MPDIFQLHLVFSNIPQLLEYLPVTLYITIVAMFFSLVLGLIFAVIKINKIPILYHLVTSIVSFLRGTPLLVQLYLSFYGIPILLRYINYYYGTDININGIHAMFFVLITFSFNESAYNSETIRAALLSVDKGQIEAAKSLGMTYSQILFRILVPQAFVVALPTLGNTLIGLLKGTSLAFVCTVIEITAQAQILAGGNYRYFESYMSVALIYWVVTMLIEQLIKFTEHKLRIPDTLRSSNLPRRYWL